VACATVEPGGTRAEVLLGLGSNIGRPAEQLRAAVRLLAARVGPLQLSSLYRTAPVGYLDQPHFLNLVCRGDTDLAPVEVLRACQRVEAELGRTRPFPNAPRTIDIDLLAHGEAVLDTRGLTLPHPRLHLRGFVLVPLVEIAPGWRHPVLGRSARELLRDAGPLEAVERLGPLGGGWESAPPRE
jgi:2-amino-4-hydroxy-6-hydroxymethyldihydropteridine diphosphokinase